MLLSFELTMPNVGSWNGKWTGADKKYYIVKSVSAKWISSQEWAKKLLEKQRDSFYYNFGDGWGANVTVEVIDATEAKKRRKNSKGFAGYDWMVDSIMHHGEILDTSTRKAKAQHDKFNATI